MSKLYQVTIKGTGQLNGPKRIHNVINVDEKTAQLFSGSERYVSISEFVKQNYPGVNFDPKDISANVVYLGKNEGTKNISKENETVQSMDIKSYASAAITGAITGAIAGAITGHKNKVEEKIKEKEKEREQDKKQKEYIQSLSVSVRETTEELESISIPNQEAELIELLDNLIYKLKSNKWKPIIGANNDEEAKLINKLMDAYFLKFSMGLRKLIAINVSEGIILSYHKEFKRFKKQKVLRKFGYIFALLSAFAIFFLLYSLGVIKD